VLDIIDEGEPVLVHCFHGQNRAGYAVAAYRVLRQGWTWDDAMGEMLSNGFRPSNLDNQGLHRALKELLGGS
jgi:protein tyrosine/serine phosphatase